MSKPSEKINQLLPRRGGVSNIENICDLCLHVVMECLAEESEKPKYVCPNCHRIVDELIKIAEAMQERSDGSIDFSAEVKVKEIIKCKHCLITD